MESTEMRGQLLNTSDLGLIRILQKPNSIMPPADSIGMNQNAREAARYYKLAADQNDADALFCYA
jgi:hypothetical protein